jgi:hypothetical protein
MQGGGRAARGEALGGALTESSEMREGIERMEGTWGKLA